MVFNLYELMERPQSFEVVYRDGEFYISEKKTD